MVEMLEFSPEDFVPLSEFIFLQWNTKTGLPYSAIRPLNKQAAYRVSKRKNEISSKEWDLSLPTSMYYGETHLILPQTWGEKGDKSVQHWLENLVPPSDTEVICYYQPQWAVLIPWKYFCIYWNYFIWEWAFTWPVDELWILQYYQNEYVFGYSK